MIAALLKYFPVVFTTLARMLGLSYALAKTGVPVCLAPNGTVAANGIITLGTALQMTYGGGIWLRLPAGAVSGGAAGLYWAVMTSTTQGQVYTNFVDPASPFTPYIPSGTLTPAVGSNAAYTQTTGSLITLANVNLPGGTLGNLGGLEVFPQWSYPNNANSKALNVSLAGTGIAAWTNTTTLQETRPARLKNRGVHNRQVNTTYIGYGTQAQAVGGSSVDTSVNCAVTLAANLAVATDYIVLESFDIQVMPS